MIKKIHALYDWVVSLSQTPYAILILFLIAFSESFFFPIPPDVLLIALGVAASKKSFKYSLVCSVGSITGGCVGYLIGHKFMELIGKRIIEFYNLTDKIDYIGRLYNQYDAWAIGIAGFTPIPYKVFTITAGAFNIDFSVFIIASAISRSLRFFIIGALIYIFGPAIQSFINKYFNILAVLFVFFLVLGFIVIRFL